MASPNTSYIVCVLFLALAGSAAARPVHYAPSAAPRQPSDLTRLATTLKEQLAGLSKAIAAYSQALAGTSSPVDDDEQPDTFFASEPQGYAPKTESRPDRAIAANVVLANRIANNYFQPDSAKGTHTTVMLKPDGKVFKKSWTWNGPSVEAHAAPLAANSGDAYAAAASYPSLAQQNTPCDGCIGKDTRLQVTPAADAAFPQTAIGQLTATSPGPQGGAEWCTGAMVSPLHVLTAAHCIWDVTFAHAPMSDIAFAPAQSTATSLPFGKVAWQTARLLDQFKNSGNYSDTAANTDFAVVTLSQPIGKRTGWMGLEYSPAPETTVDLSIAGYPADKPSGTKWGTTCPTTQFFTADPSNNLALAPYPARLPAPLPAVQAVAATSSRSMHKEVQHRCDSTHGQSGSPMFDAENNVRAVLTGGNDGGINWGIQIDHFVFSTILGWMQEDGEFTNISQASAPVTELANKSGPAAADGST